MMNQEGIFKKVGQILNELQDQYDFLAKNPSLLNELELELFLANANFLSDHVQIIKKFNNNKPLKGIPEHTDDQSPVVLVTPVIAPEPAPEPSFVRLPEQPKETEMSKEKTLEELEAEYTANELAYHEKVDEDPEPLKFELLLDSPGHDKFEFEEQSIETIFDRPLSKDEEEIIAQKQQLRDSQLQLREAVEEVAVPELVQLVPDKPEEKIVQQPASVDFVADKPEEKIVQQPASVDFVADKPEEKIVQQPTPVAAEVIPEPAMTQEKPTLNDLLAGKSNLSNTLNDDKNNKPNITDLKQAINLNEKLLYIKDLFNGYNLAYAEAIELINKMPDFKTADNFLQNNYAVKNNWTAKQSTVDKFYDLLNQRFDSK